MSAAPTLVRVQANGQVTLPAAVRRRMGLQKGDVVAIVETPDGLLISPRDTAALIALDEIGNALKEQGLTLEDMIERGREIREKLYREQYDDLAENRT